MLSRSFRKPDWFDEPIPPPDDVHVTEYIQMLVMSEASVAEAAAFVVAFHAQHHDHPYPAALIDPRHWTGNHTGRWP
jgi:hypothetical protein